MLVSNNNRSSATIVGTANKGARVFEDNVAAGTYYYWIRARNQMPKQNARSSNALTNYFSSYFPVSATGGEAGSTTDVVDGATGTSNAIVFAYKRATSTPSDDPGQVTVTLSSGTITTPNTDALANSWFKTPPASQDTTDGTDIYWCAATASGTASTDTINANEWSDPELLTSEGTRAETVYIYQRTATDSAPAQGSNSGKPEGNSTYTFSNHSLSFTTANGWQTAIPNNDNAYLWICQATAVGRKNATQDIIAQTEWSAPVKLANDGVSSRAVRLTSTKQGFTYNPDTDTTSDTATITATPVNSSGTQYYKWFLIAKDGTSTFQSSLSSTAATFSYTPTTNSGNMPQKVRVELYEDSSRATKLAEDEITLFALIAGSDAVTAILTNEAHGVPKNASGTPDFTNSGTDIKVWWGNTQLERGNGQGQFQITNVAASDCTTSGAAGSHPDVYTYRQGVLTAISAATASLTYTIRVRKIPSSTYVDITKVQTFSTSQDGAAGTPGTPGTPGNPGGQGVAGTPGGDGESVAIMFIFKRSSSQPTTPSGSTFNFNTMTWSGLSGWEDNIADVGGSDTTPIWQSRAMFVKIDGGSSTPGPNSAGWSTPKSVYKAGVDGTNGTNGTNGTPGNPGATGPTGPTGPAGPGGPTGPTGPQGIQGATGPGGTPGGTGPPGPQGGAGGNGWSVSCSHNTIAFYDTSTGTGTGGSPGAQTVYLYANNGSSTQNTSFTVTPASTYNTFTVAGTLGTGWSGLSTGSFSSQSVQSLSHSSSGVTITVTITRIVTK